MDERRHEVCFGERRFVRVCFLCLCDSGFCAKGPVIADFMSNCDFFNGFELFL